VATVSLALARLHGARWGVIGALGVATLPTFAIFASNQQADIPLSVYVSCAAALLMIAGASADRSLRLVALAGFSAGLGTWTKNEGALYALCLAAGVSVSTLDCRAMFVLAGHATPSVS